MPVDYERTGAVTTITLARPEVRNAVDRETASALHAAFLRFEADDDASVAVLTGAGGTFCAGADLRAIASGTASRVDPVSGDPHQLGPMGPTRLLLTKPTIAAVEGFAVAGGLELALWCDLRVAARDAVFGVYCRRFGVPLVDGGTVRLPRLVGQSHALDMILTGRGVSGDEALRMGLANRLVEPGAALTHARALAAEIAAFPPSCMRSDRLSAHHQWSLSLEDALREETRLGRETLATGEAAAGAARFTRGTGRHGEFGS